jgi:fructose-1,6-bisphosphatase-3
MNERLLLDKIDYAQGTVQLEGKSYPLNDTNFPTIDPANPYQLTEAEQTVMDKLRLSFMHSERLQRTCAFCTLKAACTWYTTTTCSITAVY